MEPKKMSDEEAKIKLDPLQYSVMMCDDTEPPFKNEYYNEHRDGIYVDRLTNIPLYSSKDKYDSGTGWPSFTRPISLEAVTTATDYKIGVPRTEVRSASSGGHLGHVFDDGPKEQGGKRFCMNSAALRFIPKEDLEKEGFAEYLKLFA